MIKTGCDNQEISQPLQFITQSIQTQYQPF